LRQVNLSNGAEGIYLRKGLNATNISRFFGTSYSNAFTGDVTNVFKGTNYATNATMPVFGGWRYMQPTNTITNYSVADGLHYVSFSCSNTSFDIFGYSQGRVAHPVGRADGTVYETNTIWSEILGAGTFNLNVTTNIYSVAASNGTPAYYGGLAYGTVYLSSPYFKAVPYP
jgi:hypothetical protein